MLLGRGLNRLPCVQDVVRGRAGSSRGLSGKLARVWLGRSPLAMDAREKSHFLEGLGNGKGKNVQKRVCGGEI